MAVSPFKTFSAGEVLTASDLNDSFSQVFDNGEDLAWPATKAKDFNGQELQLDADADTVIVASTDDQIDFKPGATTVASMTATNVTVNKVLQQSKGSDVASATALTLGTDGNIFDITGTTTITSIGTLGVGTVVFLHFDGALTVEHDAATGNIVLPGGNDITTQADTELGFYEYDAGKWRLFHNTDVVFYASIPLWYPGAPTANAVILGHVFDRAVTFPTSLTNSQAYCLTTATDGTVNLDIQKNGASQGSVDFSAGTNTGTFTFASDVSFATGDRLTVVAPNPADSTFADIMLTLQGTRS